MGEIQDSSLQYLLMMSVPSSRDNENNAFAFGSQYLDLGNP